MRTKMLLSSAVLALVIPASAQTGIDLQVPQVVRSFVEAERAYDAAALSRLISPDFIEVSPAGEVDTHDRFLSFYSPDKKTAWPPFTLNEQQPLRIFGDTAIDIVTFHYDLPGPGGAVHPMEIRSTFVLKREGGSWKLIQTQHTGIRPLTTKAGQ